MDLTGPVYKAVIRYKLITRGRKIIGVDPESRQVEYLPADEEGRKAFEWFINHLYKELLKTAPAEAKEF